MYFSLPAYNGNSKRKEHSIPLGNSPKPLHIV
jgi:hypothetical protein